jgi:hypothetical protein
MQNTTIMKTKLFTLLLSLLFILHTNLFSQGFTPPSEGKCAIYFTRVTLYGGAISFDFFHQDKYIGRFKGKNYLRYECEPGEQLLWVSSENKEFVTSELEAGKSYIVLVNVIMGVWKARVGLEPIDETHKAFVRAKELIKNKPAVVNTPSKKAKVEKKLKKKNFIENNLKRYENEWKSKYNFRHINKDMAIPESQMKP